METIDEAIMRICKEKPSISQKELEMELKEVKDPFRSDKQYWKNSTIRNRVHTFFKSKEPRLLFAPSDDKPSAEIEGTEIKRHEDIFAPRETFLDAGKEKAPETKMVAEQKERKEEHAGILLDNKLAEKILDNIKGFKCDLVTLVGDVKVDLEKQIDTINKQVANTLSSLKQDFSIQKEILAKLKQSVAIAEPEVKYDFLELKLPLIEQIKKTCNERNIDDESDYINQLLETESNFDSILAALTKERDDALEFNRGVSKELLERADRFDAFTKMITEAGGVVCLTLDYNAESGQLGYKRGISRKRAAISFAACIGLGIALGLLIMFAVSYFKLI